MTIEKSENPGAEIPLGLSSLGNIRKELGGCASVVAQVLTNENPPAEYELPSRRVRTTLPQSTKPGKTLPQSTKKKNGIGMEFRFLGVSCLRSGGI